jgi:phospholipase C
MQNRRRFLSLAAASTGALAAGTLLPASILRALAIPASSKTGTIKDVEHVVIFMQENRSFDHYFGSLRGVRGYGDRFAIELPNGSPVWHQPRQADPNAIVTPFRLDTTTTSAQCVGDLDHSWVKTQAAINGGRYDQWPANKTDMTMGYHTREDIPYHYALADAFTVCDNYFCSIPSQTHPNRTYLMTGMVDPTGAGGGPLLDNRDPVDNPDVPALTWTTFPERLEAAGIDWQLYQQGLDFTDDFTGNFGTNVLANFKQFIDAPAGSPLRKRGMSVRTLDDLKADVKADKLPQVSWLLPPAAFSEHPRYTPAYGADYTSLILDALTSNPEVWSKTVFFIMYDENDGFFDHVVPPQPPTSSGNGISTVGTEGELHDYVNVAHKPLYEEDGLPFGLGPRVPMTVVSPWSKGGFVCSQVFDHTSVIQFVEKRFGVHEPNLTTWRRTVSGDLSSAFDFARPDAKVPHLPNTAGYRALADTQCKTLQKPTVPATSAAGVPRQEPGVRLARPLPYRFTVDAAPSATGLTIAFGNTGKQGANFYAYEAKSANAPRTYTIGAGHSLDDAIAVAHGASYDVRVYGPNGFHRRFRGTKVTDGRLDVAMSSDAHGQAVFALTNHGSGPARVVLHDNAYGAGQVVKAVPGGKTVRYVAHIEKNKHWYDVSVSVEGDVAFLQRFAGHVETGSASTSDPAA